MVYNNMALWLIIAAGLLWNGEKVVREESEWRSLLGRERYCVMRKKATERPFSGDLIDIEASGTYRCAGCGLALFHSSQKSDLRNGWLNFHSPIVQRHIWIKEDFSLPLRRYEVLCRGCDSHLGHVFRIARGSNLRYTINSLSLSFHLEPL